MEDPATPTYYVTGPEYSTHFKPHTPQYKKLKNGMITSQTLKIMDQANNIITDGPRMTVVLHIKQGPLLAGHSMPLGPRAASRSRVPAGPMWPHNLFS